MIDTQKAKEDTVASRDVALESFGRDADAERMAFIFGRRRRE